MQHWYIWSVRFFNLAAFLFDRKQCSCIWCVWELGELNNFTTKVGELPKMPVWHHIIWHHVIRIWHHVRLTCDALSWIYDSNLVVLKSAPVEFSRCDRSHSKIVPHLRQLRTTAGAHFDGIIYPRIGFLELQHFCNLWVLLQANQ